MLPDFTPGGLLPPGAAGRPYATDPDEIKARFVIERGSPAWRVDLFARWSDVRSVVAELCPGATWWLWGCFVSSHDEPLFGEHETLSAMVLLPAGELTSVAVSQALVSFLARAEEQHRVDVRPVFAFDVGDPRSLETVAMVERWRAQAAVNVADHTTMELVTAGWLEVRT
jgi:hypothetical protein